MTKRPMKWHCTTCGKDLATAGQHRTHKPTHKLVPIADAGEAETTAPETRAARPVGGIPDVSFCPCCGMDMRAIRAALVVARTNRRD